MGTVIHVRCSGRLPEESYRQVLEQLADMSSVVQVLPPTVALMELKGALRYHGSDARYLGEVLRGRTIFRLGVDVRVGIGPSITVAATASAQIIGPGGVLAIDPDHATSWLSGLPVEALHGIGPRQAQVLHNYGVHSVGLLAAFPPTTSQRLLGGRAGRTATDRARGIGPRSVGIVTLVDRWDDLRVDQPGKGRPWGARRCRTRVAGTRSRSSPAEPFPT
jgi:DNA polymerase-4